MIYFVESSDGLRVKIGTTIRLSVRLKQLRAKHGKGLKVMAVTEGSFVEESKLHADFAHLRLEGEWFLFESPIRDFVRDYADAWDGTNEVPFPPPDETLAQTKVDRLIVSRLRQVAGYRGVTLAELISDILRGPTNKIFNEMIRESDKEAKG